MVESSEHSAIFAGSFNPITLGHLALIRRAARLFRPLIVAVGTNARKRYAFDGEERLAMVRDAIGADPELGPAKVVGALEVIGFAGLLVDLARERDCHVLVRGVRDVSDFSFEQNTARVNRALAPDIESVWLPGEIDTGFLSSSMVREIAINGGDPSPYVPSGVAAALVERLGSEA